MALPMRISASTFFASSAIALVARALASIQHRISPDKEGRPYPASLLVKGRRRQNAALT